MTKFSFRFLGPIRVLLEKFWQNLLYVTDDAIANLYVTQSLVKYREISSHRASSVKFSNRVIKTVFALISLMRPSEKYEIVLRLLKFV